MIKEYKEHVEHQLKIAQIEYDVVMNCKDGDFIVQQYRGPYAMKNLKRI